MALKQLKFRMDFLKDQEEHLNSNRKNNEDMQEIYGSYMECVEFN